jgi:transposase-like protein
VAEPPSNGATYDVTCPHCSKPFTAAPMQGAAQRHQGFKCPHCRLFVALDRVEQQQPEPAS